MKPAKIRPQNYYRLPWSLTDNGISWLEVTTKCNLSCEGCYRDNEKEGHKTLDEIARDLMVFKRERKSDCISIAGGDPLVHPKIVEIVKMIHEGGWKPVLNTNGLALTKKRLRELKKAGVFGFTFHIDTSQKRKDSHASTEGGHNELRLKFAKMLAEEGGISCSFNQTVTSDTLDQIPEVVKWAKKHPDIVHTIVFILYRDPRFTGDFDFYANGKKINLDCTYEASKWGGKRLVRAGDVVSKIREVDPQYEPCAYLNGTEDPDSTKWLVATSVASKKETYGYVSPGFMEKVQQSYHLINDRWLSYTSPSYLKLGRSGSLAFGAIDKGMRKIVKNYLKKAISRPGRLLDPAYFQTFTIIQPIDMMPDGRMNMCDGCPDMTVYNGKLYWSCRLEEVKEYGCFVTGAPRRKSVTEVNEQPKTQEKNLEVVPSISA